MFRPLLVAGALASALCFAATPFATPQAPGEGGRSARSNPIPHEPVLIYSYSGVSEAGSELLQLMVFSSGFATVARCDESFGSEGFGPADDGALAFDVEAVQTAFLDRRDVRQLRSNLIEAGALRLRDQAEMTDDIPLHTVTTFDRGRASTFSYWSPMGRYDRADGVVRDFLALHFPGV